MMTQILSPERNLMLSKTYFIRPISGQVVLFLDNETWKIFKVALSKLFVTVFTIFSGRTSEEFSREELNRF